MSRRTPIALIAFFAAASIASTAHAQPSSSEPAPGPKTGLSHINGVPIKVGEHKQYYYDYKKWNISGNPLGAMFGLYNVALTRAISPNVALSGELMIIQPHDGDESMSQLSLTAPIYFKHMHQSFYLEPGILMRKFSDDDKGTFGPQILVGWHWSWDSGANVQFAFGMGRNLNATNNNSYDDYESGGEDVFGTGYFRVGYAF